MSDFHDVNPSTQPAAKAIGLTTSSLSLIIGVGILSAPSYLVNFVFSSDHPLTTLELTMTRLTGGLILSVSVTAVALVLVDNYVTCRLALASHSILGLLLVLVGLLNDRLNPSENDLVEYEHLLGGGATFIVLSCLGMIASFWPLPRQLEVFNTQSTPPRWCCWRYEAREELLERLLDDEANEENPESSTGETSPLVHELDIIPENSRIQGSRRLIKLAAPQMSYLYLGCAALLVRLPFSLSIPHFVSTTLGALARGDFHQARTEILLLFILGSIDALLDFWCIFLFGYAKERIVKGVRIDLMSAILCQDVAFFDRHTSGDLSSRLSSDCGAMATDLTWFFRFSIESVVRILGISVYMVIRCPILGGCALSIVPVVAIVNKVYGDWLSKNAIQVQTSLAQANSAAQEAFACVRTVIAFCAENAELSKYKERVNEYYRLNVLQLMMQGIYYMIVSTFLINTVVQSALLLIGTVLIQHGQLTSDVLLAFMLYQGQLQSETMNLFNSYSSLIKSSGAGDKVFELLDREPPAPGTGSSISNAEAANEHGLESPPPQPSHSSVKIQDVKFFYPTRPAQKILNGLTLTIPAGSTTALVGSSGCGKSTIIALLKRFYDPISGSVMIDSQDLRSIDVKEHRRRLGVVTQDPVLFTGSIFSNITYGCHGDVTREAVEEAARQANAHDFIVSFPDGYDTEVGERGIALSGGQKQRIAIARAIVRNPSMLLLDEATSSLDADSETIVQAALDHLLDTKKDMTTVVVAHRLRTVRNADNIAYIHEGQVAEQGTHEQLMRIEDGFYRKMVRRGVNGRLPDE